METATAFFIGIMVASVIWGLAFWHQDRKDKTFRKNSRQELDEFRVELNLFCAKNDERFAKLRKNINETCRRIIQEGMFAKPPEEIQNHGKDN